MTARDHEGSLGVIQIPALWLCCPLQRLQEDVRSIVVPINAKRAARVSCTVTPTDQAGIPCRKIAEARASRLHPRG